MIEKREICIFVLLCQGIKFVIDWLRLFDKTSFYVTLIVRTIRDIAYFMIILMSMLFYFGLAVYMLQLNNQEGSGNDIVPPIFENFLVDSTLHQILMIFGEFNLDGFEGHINPVLCYAIFIVTVFMSQLTILNMLIAIMADTFDRVIEQRPTFQFQN